MESRKTTMHTGASQQQVKGYHKVSNISDWNRNHLDYILTRNKKIH